MALLLISSIWSKFFKNFFGINLLHLINISGKNCSTQFLFSLNFKYFVKLIPHLNTLDDQAGKFCFRGGEREAGIFFLYPSVHSLTDFLTCPDWDGTHNAGISG